MPEGPIKAVLFDLGGTLICYNHVNMLAAFWRGAKAGHDYLRSCRYDPGPYTWFALMSILRLRWELLRSRWTGRDMDVLGLFKTAGLRRGIDLTDAQWGQLAWVWYEPLARVARTEPQLTQTIQTLSQMGLQLGILSNTFIPAICLDRHLSELGILEYIPTRLYSYQYPFRKPDPRIFMAGAQAIGQKPGHILFVGDRLDWDIRPAVVVGMHAAWLGSQTTGSRAVPPGTAVIKAISELPEVVRRINQECTMSYT